MVCGQHCYDQVGYKVCPWVACLYMWMAFDIVAWPFTLTCECIRYVGVVRFVFMLPNFYQLHLHDGTCVALVDLH